MGVLYMEKERKNQSHRSSINPSFPIIPNASFYRTAQKLGIKVNPHPQAQIPGPKNIGKKKEIIASTKEK